MCAHVRTDACMRVRRPSQRFFFGHDNDIQCLTLHPNRRFAATGQQKATGHDTVPFVCVWDVDTCNLLQRLDHLEEERSVSACLYYCTSFCE